MPVSLTVLEALWLRGRHELGEILRTFWNHRNMENLGKVLEATHLCTKPEIVWYTNTLADRGL